MKFVKNDLPSELQTIEIEIFSDLHLGSTKCDFKAIQERIKRVKETPYVYAIVLGDICNTALKNSKSDVYEDELSPKEQLNQACMLFEPIKDKILGIVSGNHDLRVAKETGIDIIYLMAKQLKIESRYDAIACLLFIRFGNNEKQRKVVYSLYMSHGVGVSGRTMGSKANGLERRGQIVDADIVCIGHTHSPMTFRTSSYRVNYQNNVAVKSEQVFVNASATLNFEEYAEQNGYKPSSKHSPVIVLDGFKKKIIVKA